MKKLLIALVILFSLTSYSQTSCHEVFSLNEKPTSGWIHIYYPNVVGGPSASITISDGLTNKTIVYDKLVHGDTMDDFDYWYSKYDKYEFVISNNLVIVSVKSKKSKNSYMRIKTYKLK